MRRFLITAVLIGTSAASLAGAKETQEEQRQPPKGQSALPYVFEMLHTGYRFENDGTGRKEVIGKVRILNAMGVLRLAEETFGYRPLSEELQISYVRVKKKDGT